MSARRSFDATLPTTAVDESLFDGEWINTSDTPQGWHCLQTSTTDGKATIHASLPEEGIVEFNNATLYGGVASSELTCFTAISACDGFRIVLQGNFNLGLLVLATFKIPNDGSTGYFSREFFARSVLPYPIDSSHLADPDRLFASQSRPDAIDPSPMLGSWHNADFGTRGIREITLTEENARVVATATGASESGAGIDWGQAQVGIHACLDEAGHPSLSALASWNFDSFSADFQLRLPGGTLAIAGFNAFRDGRMNYATREFFFNAS